MTTLIESFGLSHLSGEQKRELGIALLDEAEKIEHKSQVPVGYLKELHRRAAEDDADPDSSIPWEDARKILQQRLAK